MEIILVAFIAGFFAMISPLVLAYLNARQARQAKIEDYARQDLVAERLARNSEKLDIIHTLVNSNMTAAMQAELDATKALLAMMKEVASLKRQAGGGSELTDDAIRSTEEKIAELEAKIDDRLKQSKLADQQQQQQHE